MKLHPWSLICSMDGGRRNSARRAAARLSLACAAAFAAAAAVALALHAGTPDASAPKAGGEDEQLGLPPGHPQVEDFGKPLTPERRRRLEEHVARFKEAVSKDPKDVDAWRHLAFVHQALGQAAEARSAVERLLVLRPDDEGGLFMLALIDEKLGDKAKAVASWEDFLKKSTKAKHREVAEKHLKHLRGEQPTEPTGGRREEVPPPMPGARP